MFNEGNLKKIIVTDGALKELLINYVGEKLQPENREVTMEMVIDVLASEFPELFITVAEENYIRGYERGLNDSNVSYATIKYPSDNKRSE